MNRYYQHLLVFLTIIIMTLGNSIYFKISENYALSEKIGQIEAKKLYFKNLDAAIKEDFWRKKSAIEVVPEILIEKYGKKSVLIQYGENGKISCNGVSATEDEDLKKIRQIIEKVFYPYVFEFSKEFSVFYEYYEPSITEFVPYQDKRTKFVEIPEMFTSSEGRYRIDFYIIENPYVRMSLKYLSIDDLNDQSIRAKEIFGERVAPNWFYFSEY